VIIEEDVTIAHGTILHDVTDEQKMMAKAGIDYYCDICKKYIATMKAVI